MAKFKMRNRPKKPAKPEETTKDVGNYVTLGYLLECAEKFKIENPGRTNREIMIETMDCEYTGARIFLSVPPQSFSIYEADLETYKIELKSYKAWQVQYKTQIEKHTAAEKKAITKRKLLRRMESLTKELEGVEGKLAKT